MNRRLPLVLAAALLVATVGSTEEARSPTALETSLEGNWAMLDGGEAPSCGEFGRSNQVEFEFARSGGRALIYEPFDLYEPLGGLAASESNGVVTLTVRKRDGGEVDKPFMQLRQVGDGLFERLDSQGKADGARLVRCAAADHAVTAVVDAATLRRITPPVSGGYGMTEVRSGETPGQVCAGTRATPEEQPGWVQIEFFGPERYWIFFFDVSAPFVDFGRITHVTSPSPGVLSLDVTGRTREGRDWRGQLTLLDHGDTIEIPEIGKTFAHCRVEQAASWGMGRL